MTTLEGISQKGWFFSNPAGDVIDAKFLFGQDKVATHGELIMEIGEWDGESEMSFYSVEDMPKQDYESIEEFGKDNQSEGDEYAVLVIIIVIGIGAAVFYLKGYKPKR